MKAGIVLIVALVLGGCASVPRVDDVGHLFDDAAFGEPPQLPDRSAIFAPSAPMRDWVRSELDRSARVRGARQALYEALQTELKLDYDTAVTRTAAEAFAARAGNCLSLVILAGALAQELGIPVVYQSVHGYDTWSRGDGIAFLSGHVNLVLGTPAPTQQFVAVLTDRPLVIDFVEDARFTSRRARPIAESTVVAMFLNNRAAETLAGGRVDEAYWWARAAIEAEPRFLSSYNTLAVVYLRHGDLRAAQRALDHALAREPANPQMLTNLAKVYTLQGRSADAERVLSRLAEAAQYPPFYFLDRGTAALAAGDAAQAMRFFAKELERIPYDHELHFAIALASLRLGRLDDARAHIELAMHNSTSRERRDIYAAKLTRLDAMH